MIQKDTSLGNYGINIATAGHIPGPIPPVAQQTPALSRFFDNIPGIQNKSGGFSMFSMQEP